MFRSSMARLKGKFNINNCNKTIILLVAVVFFMVLPSPGLALNSNFVSRTCICPQDANNTMSLSYECTTIGPGSTTWRGTAFDCPGSGNQILLRHTQFTVPGGTSASCNNGNIVGSSVDVVDNQCYISRLNVAYTPALYGTTIMCVHNNGASETEIGRSTIPQVTTTPVPPPESITLSTITREPELLLTFAWSGTIPGCSQLYTITSDCGSCPASTQSIGIVCNNVEVPHTPGGRECTLRVRTDVCGNIQGIQESTLRINLKFPDPPTVSVVPTYFEEGERRLAGIKTEFMESAAFNITDNMDGSATSYIIEYFDEDSTNSMRKCASDTIEASVSCVNGLCTHFFDISSSSCNRLRPISVTVSAENLLGRGALSTPVEIRGPGFSSTSPDISSRDKMTEAATDSATSSSRDKMTEAATDSATSSSRDKMTEAATDSATSSTAFATANTHVPWSLVIITISTLVSM